MACRASLRAISTYWFIQAEHLIKPVGFKFVFHFRPGQHPQLWFTGQESPFALIYKQHWKLSRVVEVVVRDKNVSWEFIVS